MSLLPDAEARLAEHALALRSQLTSPWEMGIEGNLRTFHARYERDGVPHHALVIQSRNVYGYQIGLVTYAHFEQTASIGLSSRAVCLWLGLDAVEEPLVWALEL